MKNRIYRMLCAALLCCGIMALCCSFACGEERGMLLSADPQSLCTGDVVAFGSYTLDTEGTKPINWIVTDRTGDTLLLVTTRCLDVQKFWQNNACSWADSHVRAWLNDTFYQEAFTPEEQSCVIRTNVEGSRDHVFCLSLEEAEACLAPLDAMAAKPSYHAVLQGARLNKVCWWWTRTEGLMPEKRIAVNEDGEARGMNGSLHYISVRPALRVNLAAAQSAPSLDGVWCMRSDDSFHARLSIRGDMFHYEILSGGTSATVGTVTFDGSTVTLLPAAAASDPLTLSYDPSEDVLRVETGLSMSREEGAANRMDAIHRDGAWYYELLPGNEAVVLVYTGSDETVVIPETLGGAPVAALGNGLFAWNQSIVSVQLPASLRTIEDMAFCKCVKLQSIHLPAGLTAVGSYAFAECTNLTDAALPESLQIIGEHAFFNCSELTTVHLPDGLQVLGNNAFAACGQISTVSAPEDMDVSHAFDQSVLQLIDESRQTPSPAPTAAPTPASTPASTATPASTFTPAPTSEPELTTVGWPENLIGTWSAYYYYTELRYTFREDGTGTYLYISEGAAKDPVPFTFTVSTAGVITVTVEGRTEEMAFVDENPTDKYPAKLHYTDELSDSYYGALRKKP